LKVLYINDITRIEQETIATIGFFDGVHRGHRYLLEQLKTLAQPAGLKTAVITFPVHPRKVLQQEYQPKLLNTFEEKIQQLSATGIDYCYVIDFTKAFSEITAQDFIQQTLSKQLKVNELLIGYDHKFGKGRTNAYEQYVEYGKKCGMKVHQAQKLPEEDEHISSTAIRHLLSEGKMKETAHLLSYNYSLEGKVIQGNQLGRTIGFPTANLELNDSDKIIPKEGVYAVQVSVEGKMYAGMAYIGHRPTVSSEGEKRVEVHIFDFSRDIYGQNIQVEFVDFIRPERHFSSLEELQKQLAKDKENVLKIIEKS
jgi:riboflavin kinase/FMN adenylyltransferase